MKRICPVCGTEFEETRRWEDSEKRTPPTTAVMWITAAEGLEKFKDGNNVWAFRDGNVEVWRLDLCISLRPSLYLSVEPYHNLTWDKTNQPTLVMEWNEGDEQPESPQESR